MHTWSEAEPKDSVPAVSSWEGVVVDYGQWASEVKNILLKLTGPVVITTGYSRSRSKEIIISYEGRRKTEEA